MNCAIPSLLLGAMLAVGPSLCLEAQAPAPAASPQLVLFDTDIGDDIDDVLALGLLLSSPEVRILGVTTAWGDTDLRSRMVDRLLSETGRADIPVATGLSKHRAGEAAFSQRRWAERQALSPHPAAVDFILKQIREHPGQVTLIAVAPLTNVAAAFEKAPETFRQLGRIVMMGGSVDRGYGDLGYEPNRGPEAEYNILMDVKAAQTVFSTGVPISLMPLDSTQLKLDEVRRSILFTQSNPLTDALTLLYQQWSRATNQQTPTVFDAMAATYAVRPELCPTTPVHLRVDDRGMTVRDPAAPVVNVCLNSDSDPFFQFFLPRLMKFRASKSEEP